MSWQRFGTHHSTYLISLVKASWLGCGSPRPLTRPNAGGWHVDILRRLEYEQAIFRNRGLVQ
jgi:hypothetical protein